MRFQVWQGASGRWYWHVRARNGRVVADGAEGYASKRNAIRAVERFMRGPFIVPIEVEP